MTQWPASKHGVDPIEGNGSDGSVSSGGVMRTLVVLLGVIFSNIIPCSADCPSLKVDGFRVWVGPDYNSDWIDVCCHYQQSNDGQLIRDYHDDSAINIIRPVGVDVGCAYTIIKDRSEWLLTSDTEQPEDYSLIRVLP